MENDDWEHGFKYGCALFCREEIWPEDIPFGLQLRFTAAQGGLIPKFSSNSTLFAIVYLSLIR